MTLAGKAEAPTRLSTLRWDLFGAGAACLVIWLLSTPLGNGFFLQIDTAAHDYAALAWIQGCWDFITEKYLSVWFLALAYKLFGPSPYWETFWLALAAAASGLLVYELGRLVANSRLAGLLAALLLLALPGYQVFSRTYFGFLFPFLLLGWLALLKGRWGWAGLGFGLAIEGHFNSAVPVGLSCLTAFVILYRETPWQNWVRLALGVAAPWLFTELLFFIYLGPGSFPVYTRFTLNIILHPQAGYIIDPGITWLPRAVAGTNGWPALVLLGPALLAPWVVRRDQKARALTASFVVVAVFYFFQAALTQAIVVPRLLMSSMPFWCVGAAVVWLQLANRLPAPAIRAAALGALGLGIAAGAVQTQLFVREFTITPYREIQDWFAQASQAGRPVRFNGNPRVGMFYAYFFHLPTLVNDRRWQTADAPGQAVLIFTLPIPETLSREGYAISAFDQPSPADQFLPVLTGEIGTPRHVELWWPGGPSQPVTYDTPSPTAGLDATYYYAGSGCSSAPAYGHGTMWFYELVINRMARRLGLSSP